jgi:hypothetical protein
MLDMPHRVRERRLRRHRMDEPAVQSRPAPPREAKRSPSTARPTSSADVHKAPCRRMRRHHRPPRSVPAHHKTSIPRHRHIHQHPKRFISRTTSTPNGLNPFLPRRPAPNHKYRSPRYGITSYKQPPSPKQTEVLQFFPIVAVFHAQKNRLPSLFLRREDILRRISDPMPNR